MTAPRTLLPGEQVIDSWRANHVQDPQRAVGGRLFLTNQRLVFEPHAIEVRMDGRPWQAPLAAVTQVGTAPIDLGKLFGGGARRRLQVTFVDGTHALFVVNRLPAKVAAIQAACSAVRPTWT